MVVRAWCIEWRSGGVLLIVEMSFNYIRIWFLMKELSMCM